MDTRLTRGELDKVYAYYVGDGEFFSGVPARNLTRWEWEALSPELQAACLKQKVYELAEPNAGIPTLKRGYAPVVGQDHTREPAAPPTED